MPSKATLKKMNSMFNRDLPITKMRVISHYDYVQEQYVFAEQDVEVLTINFNTCSMRVRYISKRFSDTETIQCEDVFNPEYFNKVLVTVKGLK